MEVTSSGSPRNNDDICHNLLTLSSPTSSEGYFDSPVGSTVGDDNSKLRSDVKRSNSTADSFVSDESVESNQPENEYWRARHLVSARLFPDSSKESHADHATADIPTKDSGISPFTRELIARSRQEMERRRQKRLLNSSQTSHTQQSISELSILEEIPTTSRPQDATDLPAPPVSPKNPFDNLALVAEYFQPRVTSIDEWPRAINGSDDEQSNKNSEVTNDSNIVVISNDAEEAHDLGLAAASAEIDAEQDDIVRESMRPGVADTPADAQSSWHDRSGGNDDEDEYAELPEATADYEFVDDSTNSERSKADIEFERTDDAPMSTPPYLTGTPADLSQYWQDRSQGNASDEEQVERNDAMTNYDAVISNFDDDPRFTSASYEFVGAVKDDESGPTTSTSDKLHRDARNNQDYVVVRKHSSSTSLDIDAIFGPTKKLSAVSMQESSPNSMPSSLSLSRLGFGDQRDPCCFGRRGWLIFLAFVVLVVIAIAALVGRHPSTPSSSGIFTTIPSSAPSTGPSDAPSKGKPSNRITFSPSTLSPTTSPTAVPSAPTTAAPVFPPFAFALTFPPYGWSSITDTPVNVVAPPTEASPVIIARAPMRLASQAPAATPTTISGGSGVSLQEYPPFSLSILTYPPFTEVRPSGRNLRSRLRTIGDSSELREVDRLQQQG